MFQNARKFPNEEKTSAIKTHEYKIDRNVLYLKKIMTSTKDNPEIIQRMKSVTLSSKRSSNTLRPLNSLSTTASILVLCPRVENRLLPVASSCPSVLFCGGCRKEA